MPLSLPPLELLPLPLPLLQVVLLDPVQYPGALKVFAREVCKNDLLNFGRLHLFFPDSRLSLDLNTDKTLKASQHELGCPSCPSCSSTPHLPLIYISCTPAQLTPYQQRRSHLCCAAGGSL